MIYEWYCEKCRGLVIGMEKCPTCEPTEFVTWEDKGYTKLKSPGEDR